ncbi:polyprenyl diphosphate synthase [Candidatus Marsarchaeota archaeon]|jgi:undecaprenyl diphosphate synthase|nr:polyprenyl diphosphate synthase [Candidatus Marsarchaeota archaeon]MCL5089704.1 polyprenyl diphosphate synthase [Candidatus Marsarchaeota archaeon]
MVHKIVNPPNHLAIIPDGNRRWSKKSRFNLFVGYKLGIKKFIDVSIWAKELGISNISVWALSTENIKNRSKKELNTLYMLYTKASKDPNILKLLKENRARIKIIGNKSILPKNLIEALMLLENKTKHYKDLTINILVGYGGKDDIMHAIKKVVRKKIRGEITRINYDIIKENLRTAILPDADLIIRTSGEMRTSGFLPWQSTYSEFYFSEKYWPNFEKEDLRKAVETFSKRNRRFGK